MKKALLLLLAIIPLIASGQDYEKRIYTVTRTAEMPLINGELDDEAWKQGEWGGDFWQHEPYEARKQSSNYSTMTIISMLP